MRPLVAHCHLGLGKLYRRTGKREQAQEHLTTATTMYREMDMPFWLEQAEAELSSRELERDDAVRGARHENPARRRVLRGVRRRAGAARAPPAARRTRPASEVLRRVWQAAGAVAAAPPRRRPAAAPTSYTPKHLAEKILTSKAALEGERKQVTVLFADLKGSMELLADRDPEEARKLLDPVLERMMEAVHRYEGTVNQVMGDGIMALFGAPLAHEDHAVRACYAALRMQECGAAATPRRSGGRTASRSRSASG